MCMSRRLTSKWLCADNLSLVAFGSVTCFLVKRRIYVKKDTVYVLGNLYI